MFVMAYNLEESAKVSAKEKIYKEQFNKAAQYRQRRASQFDRIEKQLKDLPPTEATKRQAIQQRLKNLERPIYDFFVEMDERLKTLPTAAQAAEVDPTRKSQLDQLYAVFSGKNDRTMTGNRSKTTKPRVKTDTKKEAEAPKSAESKPPEKTAPKPGDETDKTLKPDKADAKKTDESKEDQQKSNQPTDDKKSADDERVAA
jgi:SMC interacting uncharacterized protein involved in chromosome segregation